jgi:hypothetical protein
MPPQLVKNLLDDITLIDLESVTPSPAQIFWLWNIFLERVNPLTKLIHVPSMQQFVVEASGRHSSVPMNSQALLFSIYLISTVTLTESESLEMLHMTRDDALHKFTLGTKAALYRAKFLETFDTTILKALVLFLVRMTRIKVTSKALLTHVIGITPRSHQPPRNLDSQWCHGQNGFETRPPPRRQLAGHHTL